MQGYIVWWLRIIIGAGCPRPHLKIHTYIIMFAEDSLFHLSFVPTSLLTLHSFLSFSFLPQYPLPSHHLSTPHFLQCEYFMKAWNTFSLSRVTD